MSNDVGVKLSDGLSFTPAGQELLEFTARVPGYYDRNELEHFLLALDQLPLEASTLEIGTEYGRSASLILQVAKHPDRAWYMQFIDARLGDHAPAARVMFQRVLDNLGYESRPQHGTHVLDFGARNGSAGSLFEVTSADAFSQFSIGKDPLVFDFIHIDAAHDAENVWIDLRWADSLTVGGDLLLHDYARTGADGQPVFPGYTEAIDSWAAERPATFERVALVGTLIHFRRTA